MLKYYYQTEYANFLSQNSYYLSYLGLDTSKSLKTQTYSNGMTWYEFFLQSAINSAKDQMILCEAALKAGREIGEKQKEEIDEVRFFSEEELTSSEWRQRFTPCLIGELERLYGK